MNNLDNILEHSGVKGMKWGVIRNRNRPGGADGRPDASDARLPKRGKLGQRLDSMKRERQWSRVLKELDNLSTKDINKATKRVNLENSLKTLSKGRFAKSKDKQDYLNRHKMTDEELSRKVTRLRAKEGLYKAVREASKEQRELGEKITNIATNIAFKWVKTKTKPTLKDVFDVATSDKPKNLKTLLKEEGMNKAKTAAEKRSVKP